MNAAAAILVMAATFLLAGAGCGTGANPDTESPAGAAELAASAPEAMARPLSELDLAFASADSAYWAGEYASARQLWTRALRQAQEVSDTTALAQALTWLGLSAWRLGDYRAARREGEAALAMKLRSGLSSELSRSYNALGLLAWNEGRLPDAATLFEAAIGSARAVADDEGAAKALGNMALVLTELGDFARARVGFVAALDAGRRLKNPRLEANALTNLAMLDLRIGDPLLAVSFLDSARRIYRALDYTTGEQTALAQLGVAHIALGAPARAFAALDSALALSRRHGLKQDEAANLELIASFYREGGELRRALEYYGQARALNVELGLLLETGSVVRREAETYASLGDLTRAAQSAEEALRIHRDLRVPSEELWDRLLLAEVTHRAGRTAEMDRHLRHARQLTGRLHSRVARMQLALGEARIAERSGEFRRVLDVLHAGRADLLAGGYGVDWEAEALRAHAYAQLGQLDSAAAAARRSVHGVERVRGNFGSPALRTAYGTERMRAYSDAVEILLQLGHVDEAFGMADAARGRALLEHLVARSSEHSPDPAARALAGGEALLRTADELAMRLDSLELQPSGAGHREADDVLRSQLLGKLARARSEYEALLVRAAELDAAGATLLGSGRTGTAEIRAALAPGEALLEYLVTPERVLLLLVDRAGVHSLESGVRAENLASRVRLAQDLLADPSSPRGAELAVLGGLHDVLIGPAARAGALRGVRRLIIVPHDVIGYLPFAALRDPTTGRYLVEDYSLIHLTSASALPILRGSRAHAEVTRRRWGGVNVFAPFPARLPASAREARAIRTAFANTRLRVGARASEAEFRRRLARGGIVHIASHGILNASNPMFSRVELARGSGAPADDGRLEVHEILELRTRSPLVFLSGCETGAGAGWATRFSRGEDYATLAQAFLYAGADNVVGTLWRLSDESAGTMAARFYRHLRSVGPAEALAAAQRDLAGTERYRAPYYWAGYQLRGDGRAAGARANPPAAVRVIAQDHAFGVLQENAR